MSKPRTSGRKGRKGRRTGSKPTELQVIARAVQAVEWLRSNVTGFRGVSEESQESAYMAIENALADAEVRLTRMKHAP